jgi:3-deoxy-manno-octulosonate cytidylyltransferase (CMP-KDO synthetase)
LLDIAGKPMIQWVYEKAILSKNASKVIIATDHEDVIKVCKSFDAETILTSDKHQSGTDRVGEVAESLQEFDIFLNIQADEPLINVDFVDKMLLKLKNDDTCQILTLISDIENENELFDFNVVKVVKTYKDTALYFSRNVIPSHRDIPFKSWLNNAAYYRHIGVYGFKRATLLEIIKLPQSSLEKAESLEQLRWLQNGYNINTLYTDSFHFGVDTLEDLDKVRSIIGNPLH